VPDAQERVWHRGSRPDTPAIGYLIALISGNKRATVQ
jgi:hypothetical protein